MSRPYTRHMWTMPEIKLMQELRQAKDPKYTFRDIAKKIGVTPMAVKEKLYPRKKKIANPF